MKILKIHLSDHGHLTMLATLGCIDTTIATYTSVLLHMFEYVYKDMLLKAVRASVGKGTTSTDIINFRG